MSYYILLSLQVFDFENLEWSTIKLKPNDVKLEESDVQEVLSPISGHNMVCIHLMRRPVFVHVCDFLGSFFFFWLPFFF